MCFSVSNTKNKLCIFYILNHSQITKAHNYLSNNYISISFFNSFSTIYMSKLGHNSFSLISNTKLEKGKVNIISKLVGISEAIRLILIFFRLNIFNLKPKQFILNVLFFISHSLLKIVYNLIHYNKSKFFPSFICIVSFIYHNRIRNIHTSIHKNTFIKNIYISNTEINKPNYSNSAFKQ